MTAPAAGAEKKSIIQEFRDFIATGDLMTIAVAFIMGAAVKQLVDSFVNDVVMGLIGLMVPCKELTDADGVATGVKDCTGIAGSAYKSFAYGSFLNQVVVFLLTAAAVFALIKFYKAATKRDLAKAGPSQVDLLTEIRDELRGRNS